MYEPMRAILIQTSTEKTPIVNPEPPHAGVYTHAPAHKGTCPHTKEKNKYHEVMSIVVTRIGSLHQC